MHGPFRCCEACGYKDLGAIRSVDTPRGKIFPIILRQRDAEVGETPRGAKRLRGSQFEWLWLQSNGRGKESLGHRVFTPSQARENTSKPGVFDPTFHFR